MNILIIDDDPSMNDLLKLMLSTSSSIANSNNGYDGIELIKVTNPDIVLIDLMISESDGWQVVTEIRKFSKVPILILSVIDNPMVIAKALDAGADDYLVKPVPKATLIAHLNNLIRRSKSKKQDYPFLEPKFQSA